MSLTDEQRALLETICCEEGCYQESASGYTICLECLHGASDRASDEAIALKRQVESALKREKKKPNPKQGGAS
jgi:hypothetical protein